MDPQPDRQPAPFAKPSGLPRLSRLPLPKSSSPNLRNQASFSSIDRPTTASTAKTKGTGTSISQKPRQALSTTQTNNIRAPAHLRTISTISNDGTFKKPTSRPLSRANLQAKQRQVSVSSSKASIAEDDHGSTYSFQSDATYSTNATSPAETPMTPTFRKSSRPSLSERTIESLASIPPSPASIRQKSSFFSSDSPMGQRSRPASAFGNSSRPTSRDEPMPMPATPRDLAAKPSMPNLSSSTKATPGRATPGSVMSKTLRARSPTKASTLRSVDKDNTTPATPRLAGRGPARGSKTVIARTPQPRGSVTELFGGSVSKPLSTVARSTTKPLVKKPLPVQVMQHEDGTPSPKAAQAAKSSAALREQIRLAKAARLSSSKPEVSDLGADFDPGMITDPFNQKPKNGRSPICVRVDAARSDGRLNIANMGLKEIPEEVLKMYDYEFNKDSDIKWAEVMDISRFIAADNEIETIPDAVFPDINDFVLDQDEDVETPKFGGLELLDLHGNVLFDVPRGLRRLGCLTSLNLSRNRLMNDALETIAQITSLRELKIADNMLTGELNFIEQLTNLEVLEVQDNKLSVLPDEIRDLVKLRFLNVSNNQLTELPILELSSLPLVELLASKNKLSGTLFTTAGTTMSRLHTLDVSVNALTVLYSGTAGPEFPCLRTLNIAYNQLTTLPDISAWTALTTVLAEDNKITELPVGFTESSNLKTADFTGNSINRLDERVALMDCLETFKVAANPLRERKFLTMSTPELKKELGARLGPVGFME